MTQILKSNNELNKLNESQDEIFLNKSGNSSIDELDNLTDNFKSSQIEKCSSSSSSSSSSSEDEDTNEKTNHFCSYFNNDEPIKCNHNLKIDKLFQKTCIHCDHNKNLQDSLHFMSFYSPAKIIEQEKININLKPLQSPTVSEPDKELEEEAEAHI